MPATVTVASFALDAGSYAMSGKTLSDQGLSAAMDEDCALARMIDEKDDICRRQQSYEVAHGTLTPLPRVEASQYAQLAQQVHEARSGRANYLAAGMMVSEI